MALDLSVPWHRESFERFVRQYLPRLLEERMSLVDYQVEEQDTYTFSLKLVLGFEKNEIEVKYEDLPQPDKEGLFRIEGHYRVVVPYPSRRELEEAEIYCVGEQLHHFFGEQLGEAPDNMPWDAALVRNWLPIDAIERRSSCTSLAVMRC